jgi:hypothetical protein
MSKLLTAAIAQSASFDPMLRELCAKKLSLSDLVASGVPAKDKVRILKTVARNMFKAFEVVPNPIMVMEGLAESQEVREKDLLEQMEMLQALYADAYLEANQTPPEQPLGYYAVRMGESWVEIHKLSAAMNPDIQAMRNVVQATNYFG